MAAELAGPKGPASLAPVGAQASVVARPDVGASASQVVAECPVLAPGQAAVPEADPVWAVWAAPELVQPAEVVLALLDVEPLQRHVVV
ncbi:hypothetical protein ACGFNY_34570 [Streptomyces chartreusis]|uniref:hypothetical protein n=1 Tax=Streptomyces chartreusis TaxID=1969 RepID=UPI003719DEB9